MGGVGTFDDFFVAVVLSPLLAASSFALIMVWMFGVLKGKAVGRHNKIILLSPKKCAQKIWPLGYVSRDSAGAGIKIGKKKLKNSWGE